MLRAAALIGICALPFSVCNALRSSDAACEITEISASYCSLPGWVQAPDVITKEKQNSYLNCASKCKSMRQCKSLRYVDGSKTCYIYGSYLEDMFTDFGDKQPGILSNANCFTTDCKQITACDTTKHCLAVKPGDYNNAYAQYYCAYGYTARPYKHFQYEATYNLRGNLSACAAIRHCALYDVDGSLDIHYHIPSNKWVCHAVFNDPDGYYYPSPEMLHDTPARYTLRNDSVGAGYGFYLTFADPGD